MTDNSKGDLLCNNLSGSDKPNSLNGNFKPLKEKEMEDVKVRVAQLIRETRKAKGLTQKELGKRLGVTESTFGLYESGKQNLTLETLQKIADALGVAFDPVFK